MRKVALFVTCITLLPCAQVEALIIHVPGDQPTIQGGIDAASYGDTVLVTCDTYSPDNQIFLTESGICLRSETGEADCVTINGDNHGGAVLLCAGVDSSTSVIGFTIADGNQYYMDMAGGVLVAGSPKFRNVHVRDCVGTIYGGMVCGAGEPTLTDVTFTSNRGDNGGGLYCTTDCSARLTRVTFYGNRAYIEGGGMGCISCTPTLEDVVFDSNQSDYIGGGLYCHNASPVLTNVRFAANTADHTGGGIHCENGSSPGLTGVVIVDNSSDLFGGGLYCQGSSSPTLTYAALLGNNAMMGGGMYCEDGCDPVLTNVTCANNQGSAGAGISCQIDCDLTIANTIVAFNELSEGVLCSGGSAATATCCDVYGNSGGDWVGCLSGQHGANGNISEDPLFCGGANPYLNYSLDLGSPCTEANSACGLVGAWSVGCPATSVSGSEEETSWGALKALFR